MPSVPDPVKKSASAAATVLESAAGVLRAVAGDEPPAGAVGTPAKSETAPAKPPAPKPAAAPVHGTKPAAGTRARIANPKAAKKVRAREE